MQKLVTLCLHCTDTVHGATEEHLADVLSEGWRIASITPISNTTTGGASMVWLAIVLEQVQAGHNPFMPMMQFPDSDAGNPVEPTGVLVDADTPLGVGSRVLSFSQGRWWRAVITSIESEDEVKIHYPGWGDEWDVVVRREELQVDLSSDDDDE